MSALSRCFKRIRAQHQLRQKRYQQVLEANNQLQGFLDAASEDASFHDYRHKLVLHQLQTQLEDAAEQYFASYDGIWVYQAVFSWTRYWECRLVERLERQCYDNLHDLLYTYSRTRLHVYPQ